jgi:hypothetical protein
MNIEVGGTHLGLAFSPDVYRTVAHLLAQHTASAKLAGSNEHQGRTPSAAP